MALNYVGRCLFYLFVVCFSNCWCAYFSPLTRPPPLSLYVALAQIDVCARSHRLIMIIVCFWMSGAILQYYEVHTSQWKKQTTTTTNLTGKKSKWNKKSSSSGSSNVNNNIISVCTFASLFLQVFTVGMYIVFWGSLYLLLF